MSRYDEKCKRDALVDKIRAYKEQCKEAMRSTCESCGYHNGKCCYYDPEEESFDYEECFRDSGGLE